MNMSYVLKEREELTSDRALRKLASGRVMDATVVFTPAMGNLS